MDTSFTPLSTPIAPQQDLKNPLFEGASGEKRASSEKMASGEKSESPAKSTSTQDDGGSHTQVEYSRHRSSYILSLSQESIQVGNEAKNTDNGNLHIRQSYTYSHLSSHYSYSSLSSKPDTDLKADETASSATSAVDEPSALLQGAANILQFIEQRIASEKADGATEAELAELWEQGLKGFVQGFNEAIDILEGAGQLFDFVESEVKTLSDQVYAGFDAIYANYISDDKPAVAATDRAEAAVSTAAPAALSNPNAPAKGLRYLASNGANVSETGFAEQFKSISSGSSAISKLIDNLGDVDASVEYGRKDRFQFELTTLDGDTISIEASSINVFYGEYESGSDNDSAFIEGMKDKSAFAMNIEGDLDEAEQAAITDLLQQIMQLADEFYNGDVEKAYEAAMELGYDENEIASYSLKLRQVEQYSVAAAYQAPQAEVLSPEVRDVFAPISDFAERVLESLNNPENYAFFDYTQLLKGISEQIDKQLSNSDNQAFSERLEQLVDTVSLPFPAEETTEQPSQQV